MKKGIPYNQGKRSAKSKKRLNKKIGFLIICIIVILLLFYLGYKLTLANSIKDTNESKIEEQNDVIDTVQIEEAQTTSTNEEKVQVDLPDKMGKYTVLGQLVIDKIGVKKEILNITEDASLNLSVTKFYGPNINEKGNFCITGHNYKNMLKEAKNLKVGDTFYLINKEKQTKVTYKIFDIYTCKPTDLECLDSRYPQSKEVTLITCNPGAVTRLIIKAKEA